MDNRKWEADAIASPPTAPASPSDGYPTNGNPLAAQNATEPGDWWFHAIGEEIRAVIVEGGLTPNISTLTQLRDAIKNMVSGGDYKQSVRVASTTNVAAISGLLTIDGVTVVAGDRVLLKNQSTASQNGIYEAAAGAWSRSADADTGLELNGGAIIPVESGTANADTNWQITNDGTVTIGSTGLTFNQVGAALSQVLPGTIIDWSGSTAPAGYLACPLTLTNISRTTYAALFAAIGTTWGVGDGSTTFGLPYFPADYASLQANANVGTSSIGAVIAHIHSTTYRADLAATGGAQANSGSAGSGANTTSTGGAANLAAGVRVLKCVKF
ncbi:MAG: tail fiber protein [Methylotenera sp.]|nr:tail fiber protein [Methylotenera sp.]